MLKPIYNLTNKSQGNPDAYRTDIVGPQRICEACNKQLPSEQALNVIIVVGAVDRFAGRVQPFQCPQEEHWACSPECWNKVAHACVEEHMSWLLNQLEQLTNGSKG